MHTLPAPLYHVFTAITFFSVFLFAGVDNSPDGGKYDNPQPSKQVVRKVNHQSMNMQQGYPSEHPPSVQHPPGVVEDSYEPHSRYDLSSASVM